MKRHILFFDVESPACLPVLENIIKGGFAPIVNAGKLRDAAVSKGLPIIKWEDFFTPRIRDLSQTEITRILNELQPVFKSVEICEEAFGSPLGNFLPYSGQNFVDQLAGVLNSEIITVAIFERCLSEVKLDLVVLGCDNSPAERALVLAARQAKIQTLQIAHGLYGKTTKGRIAGNMQTVYSDFIATYGEIERMNIIENGNAPEKVFVTGSPYWDYLYKEGKIPKVQAQRLLNLPENQRVILVVFTYLDASSAHFYGCSRRMHEQMLDLAKLSNELGDSVVFILRPHPHEILRATADKDIVAQTDELFTQWAKKINFSNFKIERQQPAAVAIAAADIVLSFGESTMIPEAMILQRPVIIMPLIKNTNLTYNKEIGIQEANSFPALLRCVKGFLIDEQEIVTTINAQNKSLPELNFNHDGKAIERLSNTIISLASKKKKAGDFPKKKIKKPSQKESFRILQIIHDFPPQSFSGTELYTLNFSKELEKRGHEVTVLYPVYDSTKESLKFEETEFEGLKVIQFNVFQPGKKNSDILNNEFDAPFRVFLQKHDFDIVHIQHLFGLSANWVGIVKKAGLPVLMKIDDMYLYCRQGHLMYKNQSSCSGPDSLDKCYECTFAAKSSDDPEYIASIFYYLALRREVLAGMFQQVDFVHTPSYFLKDTCIANNLNNQEFHVIPTGVSPFEIQKRKKEPGIVRIGFMGEIEIRKGIGIFLEAIERANSKMGMKKQASLQFKIYGRHFNDGLYNSMCAKVNDFQNATYLGSFSPEDRPLIFSEIDLLVMPSLGENYPFILREALYAGVPVVATAIAGVPEIINVGENGFLIPPGDVDALSELFVEIAHTPACLKKLNPQKSNIKLIARDAEEFEEIYLKFISNRAVAADNPEPIFHEIRELVSEGEYIDGLNLLAKIIDKNPQNPEALNLMGEIYDRLGKADEAEKLQEMAKQFTGSG